ncbi:ABC transporter permease subunit [Streptomyces sp. NPDC000880]
MSQTALPAAGPVRAASAARPLRGATVVYRWEIRKLTAQWWVRTSLAVYFLAPFAFAAALRMQDTLPSDTLFGRWVHDTGYAAPLVVLSFAGQYALPLLVCMVAGDIFASEDRHGTWKTVLTRSHSRTDILVGKSLTAATYTVATVVLTAVGSIASGMLVLGRQPLVSLSGSLVPSGRAAELVALSWATNLPPALGFTALGLLLSLVTRNSIAGALGPALIAGIMQMLSFVGGLGIVRHLLLTTPFDAWHGLLVAEPYYGPLWEGLLVCAGYIVIFMGAAYVVLRRRDFTEG